MSNNNRGTATIEACFIVPIYLFFFLFVVNMGKAIMVEMHIHQCLNEAAVYASENSYLKKSLVSSSSAMEIVEYGTVYGKFIEYLKDDEDVSRIVEHGLAGIQIKLQGDLDNKKIFHVSARYKLQISIPILGSKHISIQNQVKQKEFVGYTKGEDSYSSYVYITPNQSVYHATRNCTHLKLTIQEKNKNAIGNKHLCQYCKKEKSESKKVYTTKTSNIYHTNRNCSGLKRTVTRVKKDAVGGLSPCNRCGR